MKIDIPDLTGKECGEIAITAAEGGISYWSQIEVYQYERWAPDLEMIEVPDGFVFYTIREDINEDGKYEGEPIDITPALLRLGLERALAAPLDQGGWMANDLLSKAREDWTGEIDSLAADIIVQFGCFGELRYG